MKKLMAAFVMIVGAVADVQAAGDPAVGEALSAVCSACHGAGGAAPIAGSFPKLAGQGERYLIKQISDIKSGERAVPQMAGILDALSNQDIENLAAYYAAQSVSVGQATPALVAMGQALYRGGNLASKVAACTACHGPQGMGNAPAGFPVLSGQNAEYVANQLMAFRKGTRTNDGGARTMRDIAAKLTDAEVEAVADYVSGLH